MMKKIIQIIILFTFLTGFWGCSETETEETPILVFLSPEDTQLEANSGERIFVTISASTSMSENLFLKIESLDDFYGKRDLFDSSFNENSINYLFEYMVPSYPDSTNTILIFRLNNTNGYETEIAKRIIVNRGETFLSELSGVVIYSSSSDKPNAFSINDQTPGYSEDSTTFTADFLDDTRNNSDTLSRRWVSNTGLSFVEFNGFNFAGATSGSITQAYENGVKLTRVTNISDSDIYLVGKGSQALGAIQIIAVTDQMGVQEDKYTFSIKLIDN